MQSGFYTAASGMLVQQKALNVHANNLANQATPGYKAQRVISTTFEQEMMTRIEKGNSGLLGSTSPVRLLEDLPIDYGTGVIEESSSPFDLAIHGEGFFLIQGEENLYLTRNGSFSADAEGNLVLSGFGSVLGENGPISVGDSGFTVQEDGTVIDSDGRRIDALRLVVPNQPELLEKMDNGLFAVPNANALDLNAYFRDPLGTSVVQYALEQSNVEFNRELTMMMEAQRNFQALSTILKGIDEINQKAVNQIGSL